jgi:transposase InsO family protein
MARAGSGRAQTADLAGSAAEQRRDTLKLGRAELRDDRLDQARQYRRVSRALGGLSDQDRNQRGKPHRCLQRHGVSRLPHIKGDKEPRRKFKIYPIGFLHVDIAEVQTAQGKLYLFVAIDRTSKFAVAQLVDKANTQTARAFLEALVAAVPYRVEIVLTDNGIQFADLPKNRSGPTARLRGHPFDRACREHGIEHRLTKPNHPWTNGQVERMNRTIKDATVKRYHYESHEQLVRHLDDFVAAYNFGRRLKTLSGLTPFEFVCKRWTTEPDRFRLNPLQQMPGLNN